MDKIQEVIIERQQYAISYLMQKDVLFNDVYLEYLIEEQMYKLAITQRLPAKILQDRTIIAKIPSSNWQWFKSLFGLKCEYKVYYLNEHVTFPNYAWPSTLGQEKIYTDHGFFYHKGQKLDDSNNDISTSTTL